MNIDELIGCVKREMEMCVHKTPYDRLIGKTIFIRTVTMRLLGRLVEVYDQEIVLEDACWIAGDGSSSGFLDGDEPEHFPDGKVIVGRGAIIDCCQHDNLIRKVI